MNPKTLRNIKVISSYFVTIFSPALTTFIASLGSVYQWGQVTNLIAVIGALTTFIGAITKINNAKNNANNSNNSTEVK